jgi:hypothetical protein
MSETSTTASQTPATREDEDMWKNIAASMRRQDEEWAEQRRVAESTLDYSWLPDRCPHCRMSFSMFPPAQITEVRPYGLTRNGQVRCVDCKTVLSLPSPPKDGE